MQLLGPARTEADCEIEGRVRFDDQALEGVGQARRAVNSPGLLGDRRLRRFGPLLQATLLARVDFLTVADETYEACPVADFLSRNNQKLGFAFVYASLLKHVRAIPCALRLIEYDDMFCRSSAVDSIVANEAMEIADEYATLECVLKNLNQGAIARKEHGVGSINRGFVDESEASQSLGVSRALLNFE